MIFYIKQVMKVLAWHKDYNVVLEASEFTLLAFDVSFYYYALQLYYTVGGASFQLHRFHIVMVLAIEYINMIQGYNSF
uniref:Uncharacterized protein n=1 Tax=Amphimedon queenslandica TaxID=400682 RepID=A0A1X7UZS8_AMPQE